MSLWWVADWQVLHLARRLLVTTPTASFVTGGVFELLRWWLESRPAVDIDGADEAVQRMVKKVLRP